MLTASIVLYENNKTEILSFFQILSSSIITKVFIVDNSEKPIFYKDELSDIFWYFHSSKNIGFGSAHNIAINEAIKLGSKYHLISNIDILFDNYVLSELKIILENNPGIGVIAPLIKNYDGTVQYLPKLLPSLFDIFNRFLFKIIPFSKLVKKYEQRELIQGNILNTPIISGCFNILNLKAILDVGGYDENYFLYIEDWDLSRRINEKYYTIHYPKLEVKHGYRSEANSNLGLAYIYIKSLFYYFKKWGFIFDNNKKIQNKNLQNFHLNK